MTANALTKKTDMVKVPVMLDSQVARMLPFWCESSLSFDLYDSSLSRLATKDILPVLAPHWIEISIDQEIALLDEEHMLEVSVPVLNLCDLLPNAFFSGPPLAAKVIGFNGYAAKGTHRLIDNFPLADFCLVTDIAGNQYEIIINKEGKIEVPEEGTGLFSIPSQLTFIYSERQIKRGQGLDDCQSQGLEKNKLYIFPPDHTCQNFAMHISVSHIAANGKRIVDSIRKVVIDYQETMVHHKEARTKIDRKGQALNTFGVEIDLSFDRLIDFPFPYALNVTLEEKDKIKYGLSESDTSSSPSATRGWMQHPLFPYVFTKYFGLSAKTLALIAKKVYSPIDMISDYLKGDRFGFTQQKGYNDFLLRTEGFDRLYAMLIDELVYQRLPKNFLLDRVGVEKLIDLDFNQISVDFHDSVVLGQLHAQILEGQYHQFYELFSRSNSLKEFLYLHQSAQSEVDPKITVEIIPQVRVSTYVAPVDDSRPSQEVITKGYKSSIALNAAYLADKIRQNSPQDLADQGELPPISPASPNSDVKSDQNWYNPPPRSR